MPRKLAALIAVTVTGYSPISRAERLLGAIPLPLYLDRAPIASRVWLEDDRNDWTPMGANAVVSLPLNSYRSLLAANERLYARLCILWSDTGIGGDALDVRFRANGPVLGQPLTFYVAHFPTTSSNGSRGVHACAAPVGTTDGFIDAEALFCGVTIRDACAVEGLFMNGRYWKQFVPQVTVYSATLQLVAR